MPKIEMGRIRLSKSEKSSIVQAKDRFINHLDKLTQPSRRLLLSNIFIKGLPGKLEFTNTNSESELKRYIDEGYAVIGLFTHPGQNETLGLPSLWTKRFKQSRKKPIQFAVAEHMLHIPGLEGAARFGGVQLDGMTIEDTLDHIAKKRALQTIRNNTPYVPISQDEINSIASSFISVGKSFAKIIREGGTAFENPQQGRRAFLDEEKDHLYNKSPDEVLRIVREEQESKVHQRKGFKRKIRETIFKAANRRLRPSAPKQPLTPFSEKIPAKVGTFNGEPVKKFLRLTSGWVEENGKRVRVQHKAVVVCITVKADVDYRKLKNLNRYPYTYHVSEPMEVQDFLANAAKEGLTPDEFAFRIFNKNSDERYKARHFNPYNN